MLAQKVEADKQVEVFTERQEEVGGARMLHCRLWQGWHRSTLFQCLKRMPKFRSRIAN